MLAVAGYALVGSLGLTMAIALDRLIDPWRARAARRRVQQEA